MPCACFRPITRDYLPRVPRIDGAYKVTENNCMAGPRARTTLTYVKNNPNSCGNASGCANLGMT
jgi:hypothetical protein